MKRCFTFALTCAFFLTGTVAAFAGEWQEDDEGWRYQEDDGSYATDTWKTIDEKEYYFDYKGYLSTNFITSDGYLVDSDGVKTEQNGIPLDMTITVSSGSYSINPLIFQEFNSTAGELKDRYGLESADRVAFGAVSSMPVKKGTEEVTFSDPLFQSYEIYTRVVPPDMNYEKYDLNRDGVINLDDMNIAYVNYHNTGANEWKVLYGEIQDSWSYHTYYDWDYPPYQFQTKDDFQVFLGLGDSCSVEQLGEIVRQMGATDVEVTNRDFQREIVKTGLGTNGALFTVIHTGQYEDANITKISFVIHGLKFETTGDWGNIDTAGRWTIKRVQG